MFQIDNDVVEMLDELTGSYADLMGGRRVEELEEEIFISFERVRKAEIIGRKSLEIMRLQKELDKARRAKGELVKKKKELEWSLISAIQTVTRPLIENVRATIMQEINKLISKEFVKLSKAEGEKVFIKTNSKAIAEAHALLGKAFSDLESMGLHPGRSFVELTRKLEKDLNDLKLDEGETLEVTKEQAEGLINRLELVKHPIPLEVQRVPIDLTAGQTILGQMKAINGE